MSIELDAEQHPRTKTGQNPDIDASLREKGWMPGQVDPAKAAQMLERSARRNDLQDGPPAVWSAGWVEVRYIAAFRTCLSLPIPTGPKAYGSNWPPILHEFEDQVGQASTGELGKGRNRVTRGAPIEEISAMYKVFEWALTVMRPYPVDSKMLQAWALFRSLGRDPDALATRLGVSERTFRRRRRQAATLCAERLNRLSVRTF
ncbi:hypothetical protein ACO2RV_17065 [Ancylobacter sp. VNQ12]|uniref:hypothetical protein n=1 Tax=Ancylobacter sp. VNQ12 TaxID=3400920 RepID=UPI003C0404AF